MQPKRSLIDTQARAESTRMHVQVDTYPIGGSHMSRNARTPAPPSRRIALGFGTAAGAAVIAASFSMGTAPVAGADVSDADAVSSLAGAPDPIAFSAARF